MRKPACVGRQFCVLLLACLVASASAKTYAQQTSAAPGSATPTAPPAQLKSESQTGTESSSAESSTSSDMRFGIGDLLEISVYGVPELTTKARVGSSGEIYFPLIDYVHVEGLTPEEAQGVIEKRLSA
jgi:polysaccharide export outer membrane protein